MKHELEKRNGSKFIVMRMNEKFSECEHGSCDDYAWNLIFSEEDLKSFNIDTYEQAEHYFKNVIGHLVCNDCFEKCFNGCEPLLDTDNMIHKNKTKIGGKKT